MHALRYLSRALRRCGLWALLTEGDDQALAEPATPHPTVGGCVLDRSERPGSLVVERGVGFPSGSSKTDQEGAGHQIEVAYNEYVESCPVRAYRLWWMRPGSTTVRSSGP